MIPSADPASDRFLRSLSRISDRMDRAQQQVASGKRLLAPSDDPDSVSSLLERRAQLAHVTQIQKNLDSTKMTVDTSEQALQSAAQLMDRLQTIAAQGATGTQDLNTRAGMAIEVEGIFNQLVGISQTSAGGRYVFSGDADQTSPYQIDLTQASPVSAYGGSQSSMQAVYPGGASFNVAKTAQDIFDNADPSKNVFQTVNALRQALKANDQTAIQNAVANLGTASTHLNTELAFYGNVQNQVSAATNEASKSVTRIKTELSSIEDADLADALVEMSQAKLQQDAALQTWGKIPKTSLFNFLG